MYNLTNEDIIMAAGGPMGSPVEIRYTKYFNKLSAAKKHAEEEYGEKIDWKREGKGSFSSGDLGHTEYTIREVETED